MTGVFYHLLPMILNTFLIALFLFGHSGGPGTQGKPLARYHFLHICGRKQLDLSKQSVVREVLLGHLFSYHSSCSRPYQHHVNLKYRTISWINYYKRNQMGTCREKC